MIYGVQVLVRQSVTASSYYEWVVEDQLSVQNVMDASLWFGNATATSCQLRVKVTTSLSGVFSDTYTLVSDETVALNGTYIYQFKVPLIKDSRMVHTVRFINNDTSARYLYAFVTGWSSIGTQLSTYIGSTLSS